MKKKKNKILLAEDDKFIQRAYKDGIEHKGLDVIVASDGVEALDMAKEESPDLILLDLIMPKKNGFDVLKEIKNDESLKDIPVIVLSNLGQDSDVSECKKNGASEYLIKSDYSISEIVSKINKYIK